MVHTSSSSTLHLRISQGTLGFARYAPADADAFAYEPYKLSRRLPLVVNLREAQSQLSILQQPVKNVRALVVGPVTPVPLADFQEEECELLYHYCFKSERKQRVFYDTVPAANTVLLFALEEDTCRVLEEAFGDVHYTSAHTPVLRHFSVKGTSERNKRIFIYCHESSIDVAVFDAARLLFVNSFTTSGASDVAYFSLNAARSLGALPDASFYVAGEPILRAQSLTELRRYVPEVYPVNPSAEYNRHPVAVAEGMPYDLITHLLD